MKRLIYILAFASVLFFVQCGGNVDDSKQEEVEVVTPEEPGTPEQPEQPGQPEQPEQPEPEL